MNKLRHFKITVFLIIIALWSNPALSQDNSQEIMLSVGRDNPFAQIPRSVRPVSQTRTNPTETVEEKPELFMQTVMLKFLEARSLMMVLENMLSKYGSISVGEDNNSLIICDTEENLEKIVSEIKKADKTPQQIMVEVVIIDVQLSDDTELGINWDILSNKNYDIGYRQNFTNRLGSTAETTTNIGNATAFNTTGTGGDFSVISGTIRHVVSMLQQKRDVEILASPRVMVVSGKTASIEAVKELPYNEITNTSEGGQLSSTEFKKVGVKLSVTATLTEDNLIHLSVDSEQNVTVGESATEVPIIDTRNTKSDLLLENGQVVIIGGLRRQEKIKQINQIPILGDIPLIGLLFRYNNTVLNNTELIVFLSPRIYDKNKPIPEDEMNKYNEISEKPMLLLPEDAKLRGYHDQLKQQFNEKTATIEQLKQEIAKNEQLESELKKYYEDLENRTMEQSTTNEQLLQDIAARKQKEEELEKYRAQLEHQIMEKNTINQQLQAKIDENSKVESELNEYQIQLQQHLKTQTDEVEKLQQDIIKRMHAQRDATKKMLLERIKILQNRNNHNDAQELLLTLNSLDEILSEEIQETLNISNEFLSKTNAANSQKASGETEF